MRAKYWLSPSRCTGMALPGPCSCLVHALSNKLPLMFTICPFLFSSLSLICFGLAINQVSQPHLSSLSISRKLLLLEIIFWATFKGKFKSVLSCLHGMKLAPAQGSGRKWNNLKGFLLISKTVVQITPEKCPRGELLHQEYEKEWKECHGEGRCLFPFLCVEARNVWSHVFVFFFFLAF